MSEAHGVEVCYIVILTSNLRRATELIDYTNAISEEEMD